MKVDVSKKQDLAVSGRYSFSTIFSYNPSGDIIIPEFKVVINNVTLLQGVPVTRTSYTGGVSLFNYIGRSMFGTWNPKLKTFYLEGFY